MDKREYDLKKIKEHIYFEIRKIEKDGTFNGEIISENLFECLMILDKCIKIIKTED